jgi:catechol 2,3-dioxygenase-like lactoylglutathione lyase family enzyme
VNATERAVAGGTRRDRPASHAHAVMHCNLNTTDGERAAAFYMAAFGVEPRMRSVERGGDATPLGLQGTTASTTTFLYDRRGPRSAPALELVDWEVPATTPAWPGSVGSAFRAIGYRVPSLRHFLTRSVALGHPCTEVEGGLLARGRRVPAVRTVDLDGVVVEVIEVPPAPGDPRSDGILAHERMVATDLVETLAWYRAIGWTVLASGTEAGVPWASIVLAEDPTFALEFSQAPVSRGTPRNAATRGLNRIALAVDAAAEAAAALRADGRCGEVPEPTLIPMLDTPTGGFTVLFLRDPDGAVVELVERPRHEMTRPLEP